MKTIVSFFLVVTAGAVPGFAQWAVFDVPNLTQSIANYGAMTEQIAKQATQISNQVRQIEQFETQLKRMGDMANVKSLVGFSEFKMDLNLPTKIKTWADGMARVRWPWIVRRHPWGNLPRDHGGVQRFRRKTRRTRCRGLQKRA